MAEQSLHGYSAELAKPSDGSYFLQLGEERRAGLRHSSRKLCPATFTYRTKHRRTRQFGTTTNVKQPNWRQSFSSPIWQTAQDSLSRSMHCRPVKVPSSLAPLEASAATVGFQISSYSPSPNITVFQLACWTGPRIRWSPRSSRRHRCCGPTPKQASASGRSIRRTCKLSRGICNASDRMACSSIVSPALATPICTRKVASTRSCSGLSNTF